MQDTLPSYVVLPASEGGIQEFTLGNSPSSCYLSAIAGALPFCAFPITFTPAYPGLRQVQLRVNNGTDNVSIGLVGIGTGPQAAFSPGVITTVAGNGTMGYTGDNGSPTSAELYYPSQVVVDAAGNIFIADALNNRVRKISITTGLITTVAGNGTHGYSGDNGPATSAALGYVEGIAVDAAGNIYIADTDNQRIRMVSSTNGNITTVAGNGTGGYSGDGGAAVNAQLANPSGVAVDGSGNLYIADQLNNVIREVSIANKQITTVAGNGTRGYSGDNGAATSAKLNLPFGVAVDAAGNLYIADTNNQRIRMVNTSGIITTVAGNGYGAGTGSGGYSGDEGLAVNAELNNPESVSVDAAGNLYIGDQDNNRIRKVDAIGSLAYGNISTVAGNGVGGFSGDNGAATSAELNSPYGAAVDSLGNLYIADFINNRIRMVNVNQPQLSFPTSTTVGSKDTADGAATVTLYNIGNAGLTIPTPASDTNPSFSSGFAYDATSTCPLASAANYPIALGPGADCTYAVDFTPTVAGVNSGSMVLTDNSLNATVATQTVALSGTGIAQPIAPIEILNVSPSPGTVGQPVTILASFPTAGTPLPTGSVTFLNGATVLGTAAINSSGTATFTTSSLPVGTNILTATYSGDSNHIATTSTPVAEMVNGTAPSMTNVTINPNPAISGQLVTITVIVSGATGGPTPTGTVTYCEVQTGTFAMACTFTPIALNSSGIATFTTTAGSFSVTAYYSGDSNYAASTSMPVVETLITMPTTTTLTASANPVTVGQTLALRATVTCLNGTINSGTVSFEAVSNGNTIYIGYLVPVIPMPSNSPSVTTAFTSSLPAGTFTIYANYAGNAGCAPSSASITETVNQAPSTTTLTASPTSVVPGQPVTLTATVTGTGAGTPTGTVTFTAISTGISQGVLGTATLVNGVATYYGLIWTGNDNVTAIYNGDSNYAGSTSNVVQVVCAPITGNIAFNWPSINFPPVAYGATDSWPVTLTNSTGMPVAIPTLSLTGTGATDFSTSPLYCANQMVNRYPYQYLPQGASCYFTVYFTPTIGGSATGTTVSATLTATTTNVCVSSPCPQYVVQLSTSIPVTGTALVSSLTFNWPFLNFTPSVAVGQVSNVWPVTLTNQSGTSTTLASPVVTFTDASFAIASGTDTCSGQTLAAGAQCTFSVVFSPVAADVVAAGTNIITGTMTASGNSGAITGSLQVSGWAGSALGFNWPYATFQKVPIGSTGSTPWPLTVTNYSGQELTNLTYTLTPTTNYVSGAFTLNNTCPTLAAGASCTFEVVPTPQTGQSAGTYSATLVVSGEGSSGALSSYALFISGEAIPGGYEINWNQDQQGGVSTIDFGPLNSKNQTSGPWPITVYNNTPDTQTLTLTPSLSVFTTGDSNCANVLSGGICMFNLYFTPTAEQVYRGTLTIAGGGYSYTINTWGQATH
jgi:hypothetical protein